MTRLVLILSLALIAWSGCIESPPTQQSLVDNDNTGDTGMSDTGRDVSESADVQGDVSPQCDLLCAVTQKCAVVEEMMVCVDCVTDGDCESGVCENTICMDCRDSQNGDGLDEGCDAAEPFCVMVEGAPECRECLAVSDCTVPTMPLCIDNKCEHCENDSDCTDLGNYCVGGACHECTIATESADCGEYQCGPDGKCTTNTGSISGCHECASDVDCLPGNRCVGLDYEDGFRGNYCMPLASTDGTCPAPYGAGIEEKMTVDGLTVKVCVINAKTTCEAIDDFGNSCSNMNMCEDGGLCKLVNGVLRCTYACVAHNECIIDVDCEGTINDKYCGG